MKFAPMGPFMTELYPTNIRGTGQGFCYNAGRAIGSVFMTAIGFATAVMPLGTAIATATELEARPMPARRGQGVGIHGRRSVPLTTAARSITPAMARAGVWTLAGWGTDNVDHSRC
jgi:hypothetical protein